MIFFSGRTDNGQPPVARSRAAALLTLLVLLVLVSFETALAQPKFPPLTGRIIDEANILSTQDRVEIEAMLRELEAKSSDQIVVYTTKSLQGYPIEDFGYQLGRAWKIGQAGTNNGIVLIVAPNERKVRIEVGRGLEGTMTDLMSGTIIRNGILPAFRRGDFSAGVKAGVKDIKDVLLGDAEEVKQRAKSIKPRAQQADWVPLVMFALFILIWIMIVRQEQRRARLQPGNMQRRRRFGDGNVIVIPGGWGGSATGRRAGAAVAPAMAAFPVAAAISAVAAHRATGDARGWAHVRVSEMKLCACPRDRLPPIGYQHSRKGGGCQFSRQLTKIMPKSRDGPASG